jgi:hypothetical protein
MASQDPIVLGLGNGQVLLRGPALVAVATLAQMGARQVTREHPGVPLSPVVVETLAVLRSEAGQASTSASGRAAVYRESVDVSASDGEPIGTGEVAEMLRVSERRVRQLAPRLGGRLVGGRWRFDRLAVEVARNEGGVA